MSAIFPVVTFSAINGKQPASLLSQLYVVDLLICAEEIGKAIWISRKDHFRLRNEMRLRSILFTR